MELQNALTQTLYAQLQEEAAAYAVSILSKVFLAVRTETSRVAMTTSIGRFAGQMVLLNASRLGVIARKHNLLSSVCWIGRKQP